MVKVEAISKGDGVVDVSTAIEGRGRDILNEGVSIVKSLREGFEDSDNDLAKAYATVVVGLAIEWLEGISKEDIGKKVGDFYA